MVVTETCAICNGQTSAHKDEDIALCQGHWNAWLTRYLGDPNTPCNAHLIRNSQ